MSRLAAPLALSALLVGCGGGTATPPEVAAAPAPVLPAIDGRVAFDQPLELAPTRVVQLLRAYERFTAAELPPHEGDSLSEVQAWAEGPFAGFLEAHREELDALAARARALASTGEVREQLLAALVLASSHASFRRLLDDVPVPREIAGDDAMLAIYRAALTGAVTPLGRVAAEHYARCAELATGLTPPLADWAGECASRAETLREALASAPAPESPSRPSTSIRDIAWPSECQTAERFPAEVEAPAPSAAPAGSTIAVLYAGDRVPASHRARLLDTVRARVATRTGVRVLSAAEVDRAVALREARRVRSRGPTCGQPPPLAWVLTAAHRDVVLAEVDTSCPAVPEEAVDRCRIAVRFRRPGTDDPTGLPGPLFAAVEPGDDPDAWLAGAARLADREVPLGGMVGVFAASRPVRVRAIGASSTDPWLRVPQLLSSSNAVFDGCAPPDETAALSVDVSWRVSAIGETSRVEVTPRSNADEEAARCVRRALEGLAWPCTPANRPQEIELTLCLGRPDSVRAASDGEHDAAH